MRATPGVRVTIPEDAIGYTLRVVDTAGVPVAFTLALVSNDAVDWHFDANEAWTEDRLDAADPLELWVLSSAATHVVELLLWLTV